MSNKLIYVFKSDINPHVFWGGGGGSVYLRKFYKYKLLESPNLGPFSIKDAQCQLYQCLNTSENALSNFYWLFSKISQAIA